MTETHYDCIVMGAGLAGVTAARELKKKGKTVLLIEATGRIGGRMSSMDDFVITEDGTEFPTEEGAHFIHVRKPSAIGGTNRYKEFWNEVTSHGFTSTKFSKLTNVQIAYPDDWEKPKTGLGASLSDINLLQMGLPVTGLFAKINQFDLAKPDQPAGKFVQGLAYQGKGEIMAKYAISSHTPGILTDDYVSLGPPGHPGERMCPQVKDNISVAGLKIDSIPDQLSEPYEYKMLGADGGLCSYDELPKAIARQFLEDGSAEKEGRLFFNQMVKKVKALDASGVEVTTKDTATGEDVTFTADSVICTFSVGMLRHRGRRIFGSELFPGEKREVFKSLILPGPQAKMSLQFKECVWGKNGKNTNRTIMVVHPTGIGAKESQTFFTSFPTLKNGPFVLTALLMGDDYVAIREKDDLEAAEYLFRIIERIYNPGGPSWDMKDKLVYRNENEPNLHRKDWGRDPISMGSNSYIFYNEKDPRPIAELKMAREELKSPLNTLPVFWAGEATAPAYNPKYQPLSVHGAYISGIGAAEDVDNYLNKKGDRQSFEQYYSEKYSQILA